MTRPREEPATAEGFGRDGDDRITVFLVDDHALMRRGIREVLAAEEGFHVVGESGSAQDAARRIPAARPDVMILDVRLPDGSGMDVCRRVRRVDPTIRALMITAFDDDVARVDAGAAGASGFLLKQVEIEELLTAVRRVARGEVLETPVAAGDPPRDPAVAAELMASLTRQERRVLELVAEGLTNAQIGRALGISPKTAKNHVTAILHKLNLRWRTQAAVSWARATSGGADAGPGGRGPATGQVPPSQRSAAATRHRA